MTQNANNAFIEWQGMPEFTHTDQTGFRKIIVHFKDEAAVRQFSELIGQPLGTKLKSVWFPEAEIGRYTDKAYVPDA